jgi:phage terminase large subunit-like protein
MIEGPSGVLARSPSRHRPVFSASRRRIEWPNGAVGHLFSAEDPDGIRGYEFDAAWSDELCKWRYPDQAWSNLQMALRLGPRPRQVVTTTPRPFALLKGLLKSPDVAISHATSYDNRENLSPVFFSEIARRYEGTALGRQELMGELIEDVEGALWTWNMIEACRVSKAPALERTVVAVDPPVSIGADADACGIIVAGKADDTVYVLADWSVHGLSPRAWAERAVAAAHEHEAGELVLETNQGGEMAKQIIRDVDRNLKIVTAHARMSKLDRARRISPLYEQKKVRHVGAFAALEDEMTSYVGAGKSPDRLDALVWAILAVTGRAQSEPKIRHL